MEKKILFPLALAGLVTLITGCGRPGISVSTEIPETGDSLENLTLGHDVVMNAVAEAARFIEEHPDHNTEKARIEGYRYLASVIRAGLDSELLANPEYPVFRNVPNETTRIGLDNPDNLYLITDIIPGDRYRIWGNRGSSRDFVFQLYSPDNARGGWAVDPDTLSFSDKGDFVLWLNPEGTAGANGEAWQTNVMKSSAEATVLLVRFTHSDWNTESPGVVHIERSGTSGVQEPMPNARSFQEQQKNLAEYIVFHTTYWVDFLTRLAKVVPANKILAPRKTQIEGLPTQFSSIGHFAIADDEALIVTTYPTEARYQGFQLANVWNQSLEYAGRQTSLTTDQARMSSDGAWHFVISKTDPGAPNWLDTTGWNRGFLMLRYQGLSGDFPKDARPDSRVVKLAELYDYLPDGEPVYGAEERQSQIAGRQDHVRRRYSY